MAVKEFPLVDEELREKLLPIRGLKLAYVNASQVQIEGGACISDDGKELMEVPPGSPELADITVPGAGGLDTGVEAVSTWYYVYLIKNPVANAVALLLSLSATTPTLPPGYTKKRRVGVVRNNGAGNIVDFKQFAYGNRRRYEIWADMTARRVLNAGGNAAWTIVGCLTLVPPTADVMWLNVVQIVAGVGVGVRSMGNALENHGKGRARYSIYVSLFTNTQQFQYKNTIAGGSTWVEVCDFEEMI